MPSPLLLLLLLFFYAAAGDQPPLPPPPPALLWSMSGLSNNQWRSRVWYTGMYFDLFILVYFREFVYLFMTQLGCLPFVQQQILFFRALFCRRNRKWLCIDVHGLRRGSKKRVKFCTNRPVAPVNIENLSLKVWQVETGRRLSDRYPLPWKISFETFNIWGTASKSPFKYTFKHKRHSFG